GGWGAADFSVNLDKVIDTSGDSGGGLFDISDLDQEPRVIYQASPSLTDRIRRAAPGTVYIIFIVDKRGQVQSPKIQRSDDPVFNKAALNAVKQWRFEPGKRSGEPVRFRMRVPIKFPKQQ
ncbi:MAG: TonB family protein, partial [Planctomycetes bacterium]|nr:TonB family protein [Planctomycetota bacterium]